MKVNIKENIQYMQVVTVMKFCIKKVQFNKI